MLSIALDHLVVARTAKSLYDFGLRAARAELGRLIPILWQPILVEDDADALLHCLQASTCSVQGRTTFEAPQYHIPDLWLKSPLCLAGC